MPIAHSEMMLRGALLFAGGIYLGLALLGLANAKEEGKRWWWGLLFPFVVCLPLAILWCVLPFSVLFGLVVLFIVAEQHAGKTGFGLGCLIVGFASALAVVGLRHHLASTTYTFSWRHGLRRLRPTPADAE